MTERIVAAAIKREGLTIHMAPPARHGDLIAQCHKVGWPDGAHGEQGFFTSKDRFVDRTEALLIAEAAGQLRRKTEHLALPELCSEDLW